MVKPRVVSFGLLLAKQFFESSALLHPLLPPSDRTPHRLTSADPEQSDASRRAFVATSVFGSLATWLISTEPASASIFSRPRPASYSYILSPDRNVTDSLASSEKTLAVDPEDLSAEQCLLKLLPVRNPFFRELEEKLEKIPPVLLLLSSGIVSSDSISPISDNYCSKLVESCINELDKRRSMLEPVFNPDDNSLLQISKAERGEQLIEVFRSRLVDLQQECSSNANLRRSTERALQLQRLALLALSEIGELLVSAFPYQVPSEEKFSYLPRLLGRARVTFSMVRNRQEKLGNITIVADGFMAPLTAGNFVDLSLRKFYTQLPIKFSKRRLGSDGDFDVANLPVFGSYQEGFYDPLTAKPRRLPLELIRLERGSGIPNLAYAAASQDDPAGGGGFSPEAVLEPTVNSKPLLSFRVPGLVGMNHPEKNLNGASSEFFALQTSSIVEEKRKYLDGEYAPFGFVVDGLDVLERLRPNDRIEDTFVDEWGQLNLVKLRRSSFSEVLEGAEASQ
jgi:peptidylprolyl isomerase